MSHLLEVDGLTTTFKGDYGINTSVDHICFHVDKGETVCIVGESGCGKSVTSLSIMGLLARNGKVTDGEIRFDGKNLSDMSEKELDQIRGNRVTMIFQDPLTSLNPVFTVGSQIMESIRTHLGLSKKEAQERAQMLLEKVGMPDVKRTMRKFPHTLSGGMRQRAMIAMALSCNPELLIADEPTTALDVTIQAQILQLIKDLQKEFGFTTVFITHDLGVVANVADRVAVLYAGQMVEVGTAEEVFYDPRHPYTWALLSSLPQLAQRNTELYSITGTPPSLYNSITGDAFAPRNPYCLKIDTLEEPPMFRVTDTHYAKTWLLDPRSEKVEKPEGIRDIHNKLMEAFNI